MTAPSNKLLTLQKTLHWAFLVLVAAAVLIGAAGYRMWHESNRMIRETFERSLTTHVPEWDVSFGEIEFDADGLLRVADLTLKPREGDSQLIHVDQVEVEVDRSLFVQTRQLLVHRVRLNQPTIWIRRDADGRWNWQDLAPPPPSDAACPEIEIRHGTIIAEFAETAQLPRTEFRCRHLRGELLPSGHRRYAIQAQSDVDHAGAVAMGGEVDLKTGAWKLTGNVASVDTKNGLIGIATGISPDLRSRVASLTRESDEAQSPPDAMRVRSPAGSTTTDIGPDVVIPDLGLRARFDLEFEVSQDNRAAQPRFRVAATVHEGSIDNAALPMPFTDLNGVIRATENEIVIEEFSAANANSRMVVSATLTRRADEWAKDLHVVATNLDIDRQIRDQMRNDPGRRLFEMLSPAGRFNLDVHLAHDGTGPWDVTLNQFEALDCSLRHEMFQYLITGIQGTVKQDGDRFQVDLKGIAGDVPITLTGHLSKLGPDAEMSLYVHSEGVSLDDAFIAALEHEKLLPTRRAIELLRLRGQADVDAEIFQQPGQKPNLALHAIVSEAVLNCERFPYRVSNLRGIIDYDPRRERVWRFTKLSGEHHGTTLQGDAELHLDPAPGRLELTVSAVKAALDRSLYEATIAANPELDAVWRKLRPTGFVDLFNARLDWTLGDGAPRISLPEVAWSGGSLTLEALPYTWDRIAGQLAWEEGKATIHTLGGFHGDCYLQIDGSAGPDAAYVQIAPRQNVAWHLHLDDVRIRRLTCDAELRQALPEGLRGVVASLDPRGPLDLDLGVELKGAANVEDYVTARWWLRTRLAQNAIFAGLDFQNVSGNIEIVDGLWDGVAVTADGYIELQTADLWGMPLRRIHGPFAIDGRQVTIGTPNTRAEEWRGWLAAPAHHSPFNPYAGRQFQIDELFADDLHEGRLGLDGVAHVDPNDAEQSPYRVSLSMRDVSLREWALNRGLRGERLLGAVNAEMFIAGRGSSAHQQTGEGWIQISPAALYELPVFAQIFALPNFRTPDKTAFTYAHGYFRLRDGMFDFSPIVLEGDALDLVGQGTVAYAEDQNGRLRLDFYSKADDQLLGGISRVPLIGSFFDNWLHVRVDGTSDDPKVVQQPGNPAQVVRGLLEDFERIAVPAAPPRITPRTGAVPRQ